ncbi:hypothetical protein EDD29_3236 [Actinocorallia herbida]|uniref:HEAT repeat protein n=1 Tax=Actinocorallia herbida TaxID=58109 RepID=A0A3N1CY83_9ACTN|nr:hypothetical protein [Actinocorallia herbida]ROO85688.1 hypothetical protein EDD29_3236 [Actinocorallia herbida]
METGAGRGDSLPGLDEVAWGSVHHAYGTAEDVPGQLRALASAEVDERRNAYRRLYGNVYHQGTRWEASPYVVPFLGWLLDDPGTPERGSVIELLRAVALGDADDSGLPFDPVLEFARADRLTPDRARAAVLCLYEYDDAPECDEDDMNDSAVAWARDCHRAAAALQPRLIAWTRDPDPVVAATAAELLAWLPATSESVAALLAVPEGRDLPRASANLALAHLPATGPAVPRLLITLLDAPHPAVRLTAAVALAYRAATPFPDKALTLLVEAPSHPIPSAVFPLPWTRPLMGFAALALQRLGLPR